MRGLLISAALLPPLLGALAGCTDAREGYPSLAPRPVEREVMRADAVPPAPPPAVEAPPLPAAADIAAIVARAEAADAAFRAALAEARARIEAGRGATEGSETWIVAQQAYSGLEATTAPVADALAEIDHRRQAAATAGAGDEEAALAEASLTVQALFEAERAQLAQLLPPA